MGNDALDGLARAARLGDGHDARDRRRDARHRRRARPRSSASTAARPPRSRGRGARRSSGSSAGSRRSSRGWRSPRCATGSSRGSGSTTASRTRARRSARPARERTLLLGFSMGGAVSIAAADEPSVERRARARAVDSRPALARAAARQALRRPPRLARPLAARGSPACRRRSSRRGFERAQALGVDGHVRAHPRRAARHRAPRALGPPAPAAARRTRGRGASRLSSTTL